MTIHHVAIVGAGIAGAGLAAALAGRADIVLLEAEPAAGRHATGRSAAFWTESYGGPGVAPLTAASGPWLEAGGYLHRRGALHVAREPASLAALAEAFGGQVKMIPVDPADHVDGLRADWRHGLAEPSCADIDVGRLHADLLAQAKRGGARLMLDAGLRGARRSSGRWRLDTGVGMVEADLLVNAAGAWADDVARMAGARPIGIRPYRRTVVQLRVDPPAPADLPLVIDADGGFYFKPAGDGRLWLSPHDETPADPGDAAPEEIDVALAVARLETIVDWRVLRVEHRWAGLRSFASDRLPVYGHAADMPGFFWCAGQGGFGIQTAPAASALAAGLLLGQPSDQIAAGINPGPFSPSRFG